jgi:hypothetical protein
MLLRHFRNICNWFIAVLALVSFLSLTNLLKLSLVPVSNSDVHNTIKRLRPIKLIGLDNIPSSVKKSCCEIFVHVLKFTFNISISQNTFLMRKQATIVPVFKKGKICSVGNYGPIIILNNYSKFFVIYHR